MNEKFNSFCFVFCDAILHQIMLSPNMHDVLFGKKKTEENEGNGMGASGVNGVDRLHIQKLFMYLNINYL
jgi:hypothetical protein